MAARRAAAATAVALARAGGRRVLGEATTRRTQPPQPGAAAAAWSSNSAAPHDLDDAALNADASRGDDARGGGRRLAFVDRVHCTAVGGTGGPGCAAFWRSKASGRYGPPDGGNGGRGGDVVVEAVAR